MRESELCLLFMNVHLVFSILFSIIFHRCLGDTKFRFQKVAGYVRRKAYSRMTDEYLKRVVRDVFCCDDKELTSLIKQSIESYNIDYEDEVSTDPLANLLFNAPILYRKYIEFTYDIHGLTLIYYDFRENNGGKTLSALYCYLNGSSLERGL